MSNQFLRFDVELPRIVAFQLKTPEDMLNFLVGLKSGQQKLVFNKLSSSQEDSGNNSVSVDDLRIVEGKLVETTFSRYNPNYAHDYTIARSGDYIVWNQKNDVHVVTSTQYDNEWSDDLIPESLLIPVARRKVI
jgi:hypothetical protein